MLIPIPGQRLQKAYVYMKMMKYLVRLTKKSDFSTKSVMFLELLHFL